MASPETIHIVCGPTASGKSAHALKLAEQCGGVVINADSMQLYDGLHILTAHPSKADQKKIPHKLYSALHPNDTCSAGNWRDMVLPVIEKALTDGQTPIVCGGTGLYIKALTEGLSPIPDIPDSIRNAVVERYETLGAEAFFADLQRRDPVMAARFHAGHKARIIRAMEVLDFTGKSLAQWQNIPSQGPPKNWEFNVTLIMPDRETLYKRCNDRFLTMLNNGGWDEIEAFDHALADGKIKENTALTKALGVRPLRAYLHGPLSKEDAVSRAQAETRQYAKRQTTWFRHQIKLQKTIAKPENLT